MTPSPISEDDALPLTAPATVAPSAGRLLREARVKAGVHLAVLSVNLKVPVRELEALEADAWDPGKGPVFYRGLASSVCRHLRADPAKILALLPVALGPWGSDLNASGPLVSPRDFELENQSPSRLALGKVFWGAAFMIVLTGALLWVPSPSEWTWLKQAQTLLTSDADPAAAKQSTTTDSAPEAARDPADNVPTSSVVLGQPMAALPAPLVADLAVPVTPSSAAKKPAVSTGTASRDTKPGDQATPSGPEWVFTATDDSWLEVRRAQGGVVWSGTLKAGESTRIQSPLPVSVVVGRAQVVSVRFRGQPFDLKPHTQVAVARFEVKE